MLLTRLGIPKLWREDTELLWQGLRWFASPPTIALAPGSVSYGAERVPTTGGAVLAANHLSAIDPPLIGALSPRVIHYMAKAELIAMPVVGDFVAWTGAFPVRRGEPDREALRRARELVRAGHVVGVFVEGTRQRLGYPGPFRRGALTIALVEGVPIIPCGVESFGWSLKNRRACAVVWGEPIDLAPYRKERDRAVELVRSALFRLWRQAAEAIVSGLPPELPDGAKRYGMILPGVREVAGRPEPAPAGPLVRAGG